jgi:peptide/nickel transport system ATP-binding protein
MKCAVGLETPTKGEILYSGRPFTHSSLEEKMAIRKEIGMVFQGGALFDSMTVEENVAFPLRMFTNMSKSELDDRVNFCLNRVNLPQAHAKYPAEISGGMKKRVAIARALMLEPKVLLLDEPTSALDVSVQAEILNLLRGLSAAQRLTIILVSHNLAVVAHMCDRLAVMNRGLIVEEMDIATLRREDPKQAYTRQLLLASKGYDREAAARLVTYD